MVDESVSMKSKSWVDRDLADFVEFRGEEFEEFLADGWRRTYAED